MIDIRDRNVPITAEDIRQRYNLEDVNQIKANISETQNSLKIVDNELQNFKKAVGSDVTTWFYDGVPTLENEPASNWINEELKEQHLNDLYYDKATGYAYRFTLENSAYLWKTEPNSLIVQALAVANNAKDTADNKRRVFSNTPNPPYDVGDLWTKSTGELKSCKIAKTKTQPFSENDWEDAMTKLQGEVFTSGGNKIITDVGVYANLQFNIDRFDLYGHEYLGMTEEMVKKPMDLHIMIPNDFSITEAKITVYHAPINWYQYSTQTSGWGYIRSLRAYKVDTSGDFYVPAVPNSYMLLPEFNSVEIIGAMGSSGYTPPIPSDSNKKLHIYTSNDIKNSLNTGLNIIRLQPHDDLSIGSEDPGLTMLKYSGYCYAMINILGYQK